ncbi:MAG: AmpG family muropeptide MFS transporter [Proteobacteria bacterium]|nr:AmpG family muropeptide MFS transporter [Pseudomonadota bacterium]MBU1639737.1 AmpG family muropeptide MFS transporter [Pseudomonadota bacterium]
MMTRRLFSKALRLSFFMGILSGLPLMVTMTLLQAWLSEVGISLEKIGLLVLVGLPYSLKFVWAPLFDYIRLPFLGRRRGWLLVMQVGLVLTIGVLGFSNPGNEPGGLVLLITLATTIAFFSASQDILIDAFRREDLQNHELGLGSSYYVYGYRLGMLITGSGGLFIADLFSWRLTFLGVACCLLPGLLLTLFCHEPAELPPASRCRQGSILAPFTDLLQRPEVIWVLLFILLYKLGDTLAQAMTMPFYLDLGFSKSEIAAVVKLFGFWGTIVGAGMGGVFILRIGIRRGLWIFGLLQMISTAGFALLALKGAHLGWLALVVAAENGSAGMGTAAFVAYMASLTNKQFTASQYALLSSIMGIPRVVLASSSGFMASSLGWFWFFLFCTLLALPGLFLLRKCAPWPPEGDGQ